MYSCNHFKLIDIKSNRYIPKLISDYLTDNKSLGHLYSHPIKIESFEEIIKNKNFNSNKRSTLVEVLKEQAKNSNTSNLSLKNIDLLSANNTYCVTTGHQPAIFLGPLYFLYKIIHVIKLCKEISKEFSDYNFVPVYWMASEDHDFSEISSINLFNKKISWNPNKLKEAAVGRLLLDNIDSLKREIRQTLYKEIDSNKLLSEILQCYNSNKTLAQATREALNILFGNYGLIILDADDRNLKKLFSPVMINDILNNINYNSVIDTSNQITKLGYKTTVTPKKINIFYLDKEHRKYIVKDTNVYKIPELNISLSETELIKLIETNPERFSPNVVLRPLYQETILPNLAYIGGVNEISYWLQLKSMFDINNTPFPILLVRNSASLITKTEFMKLKDLDLNVIDFLNNTNEIERLFIDKKLKPEFKLDKEISTANDLFDSLIHKYVSDNKSSISIKEIINSSRAKTLKEIDKIKNKLTKHSKYKLSNQLNSLNKIKQLLLPNNMLQERYTSSLFAISKNSNLIGDVYNCFSVLNPTHYTIIE